MIAKQILGLANNGLEVIKDHQAAAAQDAVLVAAIETPEQLQALTAQEQAKTHRTAIKAIAIGAVATIAAGGVFYEANKAQNNLNDNLHAIGGFITGIFTQRSGEVQLNNMVDRLTLPSNLPLESVIGTSTPKIVTHNSVLGINISGSDTVVSEKVDLELSLHRDALKYKAVQVNVTNAAGEIKKEWRLEADITTERDANQNENSHERAHLVSTLDYEASIKKVMGEQASDGVMRRIGQVIAGSDADRRIKVATNLGMESFASSCAPLLKAVIPQAVESAVRTQFTSTMALKDMAGMPQTVKDAIKQMASNPAIVVFKRVDGSVVSPADVQIPVTPVDSKKSIANQLGINPNNFDIANNETCAMDQQAIGDFTSVMGQGK